MQRVIKSIAVACCAFGATTAKGAPPADSIEYALPETRLRVGLDMLLERCPEAGTLAVRATFTMQAVPVAGERHRISGQDLSSFFQRRDLSLNLYENGTVKTVGAGASDRTAAIVGNVVRLAASAATLGFPIPVAALAEGAAVPSFRCTDEAAAAVAQRNQLISLRQNLQGELARATDAAKMAELRDGLTAVATRIVELEQGPLKLTLTQDINPGVPGAVVRAGWSNAGFLKWFVNMPDGLASNFSVPLRFALPAATGEEEADNQRAAQQDNAAPRMPYIVLREPVIALVTLEPDDAVIWRSGNLSGPRSGVVPIAQWGGRSYYSMRAGFGRSRSLKLELDPFGRRTSMAINSESTGEAVSGALASIGESAVTYQNAASETRQQLLRINELETQQKYNRLLYCAAVIEAGGFTCPQ